MSRLACTAAIAALVIPLAACSDDEEVPSEILPANLYAARCASPRTGTDPSTGERYRDTQGKLLDEQLWLRSFIDDTYLWYKEVPRADPRTFSTAVAYFDVLKSEAVTASGRKKDRFHFTYTTDDWVSLSQSGVEAGYGLQWVFQSTVPPRKLLVAFAEPGSPGATAGIGRGAQIVTIDGADVATSNDVTTLNGGLSPSATGQSHVFTVLDRGASTPRTVTLTSAAITSTPVQTVGTLPPPFEQVGYLVFNDHIATAEKGLVDAITKLRDAQVKDLVIDLRYNGGGYLAIASQFAYMVAGPTATAGKTFEREQFNDRYPDRDPITRAPLAPLPFQTQTLGFSVTRGQALPYLGLSRVYVLTGSGTCSASEALMNGLAGVDVEVIQIGSQTCGKPYGFYPIDNCGTTYFAIQFQGVNHKGFGDYSDGLTPTASFPGCTVLDDFTHALGDPAEARLATALAYRASGAARSCSTASLVTSPDPLAAVEGITVKPAWRQNRIITPSAP